MLGVREAKLLIEQRPTELVIIEATWLVLLFSFAQAQPLTKVCPISAPRIPFQVAQMFSVLYRF